MMMSMKGSLFLFQLNKIVAQSARSTVTRCFRCRKPFKQSGWTYSLGRKYSQRSALFVNETIKKMTPLVRVDLSLGKVLSNPDMLRQNMEKRNLSCVDVDALINNWRRMKELRGIYDKSNAELTEINDMITATTELEVKSRDIITSIEMMERRQADLQTSMLELRDALWVMEEKVTLAALSLPNDIHQLTPEDEDDVIGVHIDPADVPVHGLSHVTVARKHNFICFKHIGPRSYFVKGELLRIRDSIIHYLSKTLTTEGYLPMIGPGMFRTPVIESFLAHRFDDPSKTFHIDTELKSHKHNDKMADTYHLTGVSPSTFAAYLMRMNIQSDCLPLKYVAMGTNYTPSDNELPGLLGALQSSQVHTCCVTQTSQEAFKAFCDCRDLMWNIYKNFKLPIRLILVPVAELEPHESLRADVQLFFPFYRKYFKVSSVSLVNDHISRRLVTLHSPDKNDVVYSNNYTHMVFGEIFCAKRFLAGILEYTNNQETDKFPEFHFLGENK